MKKWEYEELRDLMDGLYAYDTGSCCSGIHDETRRAQMVKYLDTLPVKEQDALLTRVMRDLYMSDESAAEGYTWEDAYQFGNWIAYEMRGLV